MTAREAGPLANYKRAPARKIDVCPNPVAAPPEGSGTGIHNPRTQIQRLQPSLRLPNHADHTDYSNSPHLANFIRNT